MTGYSANSTHVVQSLAVQAGTRTVLDQAGSAVEAVMSAGTSQSVVTKLTGTDFTSDLPNVQNADQFGDRAGANVEAAAVVGGKTVDMAERRENFRSAVEDMQRPIKEAFAQGVENLSYSEAAADASFMPIEKTEMADMAFNATAAKVGLGFATSISDGISDARAIAGGKLTDEQEAKLADQMRSLLTPTRDTLTNEITAPPAIASGFDEAMLNDMQDAELVQFFKQALLPPEDQPEWAIFMAAEEHLAQAEAFHGRNAGVNDAVLALAEASGAEASVEVMEMDAADRINFVASTLSEGSGGMTADATALSRINVAVLPADVRDAMIRDGADVRDTPTGGFANEPDERLLAMSAGAGMMS